MNKNCAFTICTRSYKGLAETLKDSFLKYNPDFDFYIIYVDAEKDDKFRVNEISAKEIVTQYILESKYKEMSFKYDVTEFCTSVKPFMLKHFLEKNYEIAVYLDPDLLFFSKFQEIYDETKIAYITPHIVTPQGKEYKGQQKDNLILRCGIYNCGFIAFRNSIKSIQILDWWCDKLQDFAYNDPWLGYFTDQRWIDFLPVFFSNDELKIIKNPGCNFAPWNYFERKIDKTPENFFVVNSRNGKFEGSYPLCFIHASGYNYDRLCDGIVFHNSRELISSPDINEILIQYGQQLHAHNTTDYFNIPYRYGVFSDGSTIVKFHRRMFRRAVEEGSVFDDPFSARDIYYSFLKKNGFIFRNASKESTPKNISGYGKKYKILTCFLNFCRKVLGGKRFIEFMVGMHKYSREEEIAMYISGKGVMGI